MNTLFRFIFLKAMRAVIVFTISFFSFHAAGPEIRNAAELAYQEELYKKYFMGSLDATSQSIWNDFLSQPSGVTEIKRTPEVVISMASYPSIIATTWLSVESLLRQENKPDKIVLNLFEEDFPDKVLPWAIQQQLSRGLEIRWSSAYENKNTSFVRSDILHSSPLIGYFSNHSLDEVVFIPYNVQLLREKKIGIFRGFSSSGKGKLNCKEHDMYFFKDASSQFKLLGGELLFFSIESLPGWNDGMKVFNPSLIQFKDKHFMTFRVQGYKEGNRACETYFGEVGDDYSIKYLYRLIEDTRGMHEDARLTIKNDSLFVSYISDLRHEFGEDLYRVCTEVSLFEPGQQITNPIRPAIGDNRSMNCSQKNWIFFEKEGSFFVINNIDPLEVWDCTDNLEAPLFVDKKKKRLSGWKYGEPRASTTPIFLEEYNLWLVFFHSDLLTQDDIRTYFLGALVFDNDFNVLGYTDQPLLISTPHIKRFWRSNDILPYGCIRKSNDLLLSLGINDDKAAIGRIPLARVMNSLNYDKDSIDDEPIKKDTLRNALSRFAGRKREKQNNQMQC